MAPILFFGTASGQAGAVTALETAFTADTVWAAITPFIPVVATVTLIALGIYLIRRIVKKVSKGKGGM